MQSDRSSGVDATPASPHAGAGRPALVVGAVAATIRVVWVLIASREPVGLADPFIYLDAASSIAAGDGYTSLLGHSTAYYPPGYPFSLGGVQRVVDTIGLGDHLVLVIGLIQALLGGVAAGALVYAGDRLAARVRSDADGVVPRRVPLGVVAGLLFACWPNLVLHTTLVLGESLFLSVFCVLLAALCAWTVRVAPAHRDVTGRGVSGAGAPLVAGVVLSTAACTWVRPQSVLLLVPAALLTWVLAGLGWRRALRGAALLVVGLLVAVVPWTLRNAVVMDAFVPMSTNTGDNLCIGFHDGASGSFSITDRCATEGRYVDGSDIEVARDAELRKRAVRWILDHPDQVPRLSLDKIVATFGYDTDGLAAWESYGADRHLTSAQRSATYWLSNLYYWTVGALALGGVVVALRDWWRARRERGDRAVPAEVANALLIVAVAGTGVVVPVLFFGDARFKIPVVPCLALLAALLVSTVVAARRGEPRAGDLGPARGAEPAEPAEQRDQTQITETATT